MKILVTGSSGTIGTRLCEKLLERGDEVIGLDWLPNEWQPAVQQITKIIDLRDESGLTAQSSQLKADIVVHLAANARVYELVEHPDRARDNFLTTFNVLEFARRNGIRKFIFAGSREAYGNAGQLAVGNSQLAAKSQKPIASSPSDFRYSEDMVRIENCESPYTASKIGGEALTEAYSRCYGIDQITFRFSNVYGMYDDSVRVVPLFIRLARKNEPITVFGKDKCLDFTYIDDTVAGILQGIDKFESAKNDAYNLAYGEGINLTDLAETVKRLLKSESKITVGEPRTGEIIRYVADISKARKALGYAPKTAFKDGIEKALEWYKKHT